MDRLIYTWTPEQGEGFEQVHANLNPDGSFMAQGEIQNTEGPLVLTYRVEIDSHHARQEASVVLSQPAPHEVTILRTPIGEWMINLHHRSEFNECQDLDLEGSGLTNSLAIRRLRLSPGESADLCVLYIPLPTLEPQIAHQRYTRLKNTEDGLALYQFEALDSQFTATLTVDDHGFVLDYPGLLHTKTEHTPPDPY
jgi:hypothetical protein